MLIHESHGLIPFNKLYSICQQLPFGEKGMCCRFCLCYGHKACYVWLLANKQQEFVLHACYTVFRQFLTRCAWACLGITPTGLGLLYITCCYGPAYCALLCYYGPTYCLLCYHGPVCYFVGCCLATKSKNMKWNGWSGYGIRLLGVTSNKIITFPSPLGSCCSVWGM